MAFDFRSLNDKEKRNCIIANIRNPTIVSEADQYANALGIGGRSREPLILTGQQLLARKWHGSKSPAEVAGCKIEPDASYEISWDGENWRGGLGDRCKIREV